MNGLAFRLMLLSEMQLMIVGVAVMVLGFFTGIALKHPALRPVYRSEFVFVLALLFAAGSLLPAAWLLTNRAIIAGQLWVLIFAVFSTVFVLGFIHAVFARARSVNAFGDTSRAWLGIVPFANFVLIFAGPSEPDESANRPSRFTATALVVIALTIFAFGKAVSLKIEELVTRSAAETEQNPSDALTAASFALQVEAFGLPKVLQEVAAQVPTGKIDDITILKSVTADGERLTYEFALSEDIADPDFFEDAVSKDLCGGGSANPILSAGATVILRYTTTPSAQVVEIARRQVDCPTY